MKKFLILALFVTFAFSSIAEDSTESVNSTRKVMGYKLNQTVDQIRDYFKEVSSKVSLNKSDATMLESDIDSLVNKSDEPEANITVLPQGKADMPTCLSNQELYWKDGSWECAAPKYNSTCNPSPLDYYYKKDDENSYCTLIPNGSNLSDLAYWVHRGYELVCNSSKEKARVYSCVYNNKVNAQVEISDQYCAGKGKPAAAARICTANWVTGGWGSCSKSCGGGTQTRSVTCPANHVCPAAKPATSQSCNTSSCRSSSDRDRDGRATSSDRDRAGDHAGSHQSADRTREAQGSTGHSIK